MKEKNIAFIDAQNLHLGIQSFGWKLDLKKFRIFLRDKFQIEDVYYCLGYVSYDEQNLYTAIQKAGFLLIFREHSSNMKGKKKGNVDVDIVFEVMKKLVTEEEFDKIVLVSGDGDYFKLVQFLISRNKLKRVLFPSSKPSSLYKKFSNLFYYHLKDARAKIEYLGEAQKKRGS